MLGAVMSSCWYDLPHRTFESIQHTTFHSYSSSPSSLLVSLRFAKCPSLSSSKSFLLVDDRLGTFMPTGVDSNTSGVLAVPFIRKSFSVSNGISGKGK